MMHGLAAFIALATLLVITPGPDMAAVERRVDASVQDGPETPGEGDLKIRHRHLSGMPFDMKRMVYGGFKAIVQA